MWESADAIFIGNQHISGFGMHISCDVKYSPTKRIAVCRTTSTSDATPRYDELYSHAMQCAGILIDMPTYGLELLKKDFQDVANWRAVPGAILVNLKDNNG